jgi:uncharacterized coiled-coil protein SlyX
MPKLTSLTKSVTSIGSSGNRLCCRHASPIVLLALLCVALSSTSRATCQEGCLTAFNTALGDGALIRNTTGNQNTAIGFAALFRNTTGSNNLASGNEALINNTTGSYNTASGGFALLSNTTGDDNTAVGFDALVSNTTGSANTANGDEALFSNTTGSNNTASGAAALFNNTGDSNTANGAAALLINTTGANNTASGVSALLGNTTGDDNTADGVSALMSNASGARNLAIGFNALTNNTTGNNNIAVGYSAGALLTTGNYNIDIGNMGVTGESGVIRLGTEGQQSATYIAGIQSAGLAVATGVGITAGGQLGVKASSARFKDAIQPMDKASEAIFSLKPVTFRYKKELDPKATPQFGLVAEEVAKVDPDLVVRDAAGKPFIVRYDEVNAMLLNEFLKAHRKIGELQSAIAQLKSKVAGQENLQATVTQQQREIEELKSQIHKVSERLSAERPAPRIVSNNE